MGSPRYIKQPYLKEAIIMAKKTPYHAKNSDVYHTKNKCTEGNNIEKGNRRSGTGGKRKCKNC